MQIPTAIVGASNPMSIFTDNLPRIAFTGSTRNTIEVDLRATFIDALQIDIPTISNLK